MKKIRPITKVILISLMSTLIIYSCEKDQIENEKEKLSGTQGVEYASASQQVVVSNITPCDYVYKVFTCIDSICCNDTISNDTIDVSCRFFTLDTVYSNTVDTSITIPIGQDICAMEVMDIVTGAICIVGNIQCGYQPQCHNLGGCQGPFNVQFNGIQIDIFP